MSVRNYGGIIWTNHALERLEARRLPQEIAWSAYRYPDNVGKGKEPGTLEYTKRFRGSLITMILKQNEKRQWLVLSCWIDPPLPGTLDERLHHEWKQYQKAPWWKKWLLTFKRQLGL